MPGIPDPHDLVLTTYLNSHDYGWLAGMYGRLYDRRSPWITRSFNVRVRSGNSPVRTRQPDVSPTSPAAIRANNNNNSNNHNNTHSTHSSSSKNNNNNNRCTTPQPRRGAFWSGNERAVRERDAVVLETARARSAGRRRPEPMWTPEQMGSTQRSAETQQTTRLGMGREEPGS